MRKFLLFGLLLLLLAACSQTQSPPEELVSQGRNERSTWSYADARFFGSNGCVDTDVYVLVYGGSSRNNKPKEDHEWSLVNLYIRQYDGCNGGTELLDAIGVAWEADLTMHKLLKRARLKTTVMVDDWVSGDTFPVTVDVSWRGTGELERTKGRFMDRNPPQFLRHGHWEESYRSSAKASGVVKRGTTNYIEGMTGDGILYRSEGRQITVDRRAPIIHYFDAWPCTTLFEGQSTFLEWGVDGAQPITLSIDQGIGDVTGEYYVTVAPAVTTTYTLEATNKHGSSSAEVTVEVVPPPGPDEFEPNDFPGSATLIDLDFWSPELNLVPGDVDWFRFTLGERARLSAFVDTGNCGPLTVIGLFDESLEEISTGIWGLGTTLQPGIYYLAVSGYPDDVDFSGEHSEAGFYNLSVTATPAPWPPATATEISSFPFDSGELWIDPGEVDWFTFSLTGTATVAAEVNASRLGSSLDSVMGLFDADGNEIAFNDDFGSLDSYLEEELGLGTYYLAVSGYYDRNFTGDHGEQGFYYLSVTATP